MKRKAILPPDPDATLDEAAIEVAVAVKLLLANGAEVIELTEDRYWNCLRCHRDEPAPHDGEDDGYYMIRLTTEYEKQGEKE